MQGGVVQKIILSLRMRRRTCKGKTKKMLFCTERDTHIGIYTKSGELY